MKQIIQHVFIVISLILSLLLVPFAASAHAQDFDSGDSTRSANTEKLVELNKRLRKPGLRGQHPRSHGVVWAEFTVEPNLPPDLSVGVLKEPGKTFPAWIRFSNARGDDDSKEGVHGMAIKLMGIAGESALENQQKSVTQDFLMIDHPTFFLRNTADYAAFFSEVAKSPGKPPLKFFFPSFNPMTWHIHEFRTLLAMQRHRIVSSLETPYWSASAYQLGANPIKFAAQPSPANQSGLSIGKTQNYLHERLVEQLQLKEATFDFLVQKQTDPQNMPIDDPTIRWNEKKSPFQKVATIRIPRQKFDSPEQDKFGENLSFSPWHSLLEHQPLGDINQVRKAVYQSVSDKRHQERMQAAEEPNAETFSPQLLDR